MSFLIDDFPFPVGMLDELVVEVVEGEHVRTVVDLVVVSVEAEVESLGFEST